MKLLAILAFAAAAIAQQAPSTLPKIKFTDTKLDNGLRVIVSEDHYRSEEHTSELQSPCNLVCRLLLEKKHTGPQAVGLRAAAAGRGSDHQGPGEPLGQSDVWPGSYTHCLNVSGKFLFFLIKGGPPRSNPFPSTALFR